METYKVQNKQNIYDVALATYGSVEGLFYLLADNPELSLETRLAAGMEISYRSDAAIHPNITGTFRRDGAAPANGERHVYFRQSRYPLLLVIGVTGAADHFDLSCSGTGLVQIDWGDNTDLEDVELAGGFQTSHYFDSQTEARVIRVYGQEGCSFDVLRLGRLAHKASFVTSVRVNNIECDNDADIIGLFLTSNTPVMTVRGMSLETVSDFLIYASLHPRIQHAFHLTTDVELPGRYREPQRGADGKYIITSPLEAVYVLTNDPDYNQRGQWVIRDKKVSYAYDKALSDWIFPIYLY